MADLLHFSGLLQTTTSSYLRSPDQLTRSINVHGDQIGSLKKRLGYSQYGDTLDASNDVLGLHSYNDVSGGTENLFAYINGVIKYNNSGTWTNIQTGLTSDAKVEFRVFVDILFGCGANSSNTYITTFGVNGTSYSTGLNLTDAPKAKFIEVYKDRLYLINVEASGVRYPDRFYYSSVPSANTITWDGSHERVYTNNGEEITGAHTYEALNELLIFKENSMHAWDTARLRDVARVGTTSHRSIQTVDNIVFFFNRHGIFAYNGSTAKLISRPIEKWIKAIDQSALGDVFAVSEDEQFYKLYIGNVTVDGTSYTNCEIRYSVPDNTFTIYSYKDSFQVYAHHKVSGEERIYAGDADGEVMQLAHQDDAVYSDDGSAISAQFMFETNLGVPAERKFVDRALIYSSLAQNLTGRVRAKDKDWGSYFSIDGDEWEVNVNPQDGRILEWHFSESSTVEPFTFEGITFNPHATTRQFSQVS
jgi:hypothetical protein